MSIPVLDLFCGAVGGWSIGLHRAGYRTAAACEIDLWRRAMFAAAFPDAEMFEDVHTVTADALRSRLGYLPYVVVGSPPCQDASVANHAGKGIDGARTGLFSEFVRIVRECRPLWCAAENVPGLRTRGLERVVADLEAAGYRVDVLDIGAENMGAPHRRRRLWIIGTRRDVADADPPELWQQQGRQRGTGWAAGEAEPGDDGPHAPDADEGRQQALGWPASGGRRGPDAQRDNAQRSGAGTGEDWSEPDSPDNYCRRGSCCFNPDECSGQRAECWLKRNPWAFPSSDTDKTGLAVDQSEPADHGGQQSAAVGVDWLDAWASWHGGCARHLELAHGSESRLARPLIAAIGDAVMPQITEAIGKTMMEIVGRRDRW